MAHISFQKLIEFIFYGLISYTLQDAASSIKELKNSVMELNVKMAVVVTKMGEQDRRLDKLERR